MGLFKGLDKKTYTKTDYYRDMEARHAAKIAAKVAPVVINEDIKEPEWLEPETSISELAETTTEEVVIPYMESTNVSQIEEAEPKAELTEQIIASEINENVAAPLSKEEEKPTKIGKQKRKKTG